MAGSMKEIKLRIKSVESTMQITKAMELVASSKLRRAKERVEHSRPYFETLYATIHGYLKDIAVADIGAYEQGLYRYLDDNAAANDVMEIIRTTGDLKPDTEGALKQVLAAYTEQFTKEK